MKIAINGFGRIGRAIFRAGYKEPNLEFIAINDLAKPEILAYLLKYDSIYGKFPEEINLIKEKNRDYLKINERKVELLNDFNFLNHYKSADIIIEATGKQNYNALASIKNPTKIFVTYPVDRLPTYIYGVNHKKYNNEKRISLGSCTSNVSVPILDLLNKKIGIKKVFLTPLNSYVAQQKLVDSDNKDFRVSRAAAINIIPRETSAIKVTKEVLPYLKNKVDGIGIKMPTPCGSLMQFIVQFNKKITKNELAKIIENSKIPYLKLTKEPLVLTDIINSPLLLYDSELTKIIDDTAYLYIWYDNEYEYACRVVDMLKYIEDELK